MPQKKIAPPPEFPPEAFKTESVLAIEMARRRGRVPPAFGSATALIDPAKVIPDSFPRTQKATTGWDALPNMTAGVYNDARNEIRMNSNMQPPESDNFMAAGQAHETGHGIFREVMQRTVDNRDNPAWTGWEALHNTHFREKADYRYAGDPSHSFADAWSVYTTSPEQLKRKYPEVYDYFVKLSGFEYRGENATDTRRLPPKEITALLPADEAKFQQWIKANKITDLDHPDSHYDYRGYWKEFGDKPMKFGVDHFTDTYKRHGHPTFSVESQYSTGPNDGGSWQGEKYIPAKPAKPPVNYSKPKP